jgi:peptidoglycan-associated lipoprotein
MRQLVVVFLGGLLWSASALAQLSNAPMYTPAPQPSANQQQGVEQNLKDVHFAFDQYELTPEDHHILQQDAEWLKANPNVNISIAGNADERGGIVYNVVLSQKRANVTRDALVALGVPAERIQFATGWGKLYPLCNQSDENCYSQNRNAHFTPGAQLQTQLAATKTQPVQPAVTGAVNHAVATGNAAQPIIACAAKSCP